MRVAPAAPVPAARHGGAGVPSPFHGEKTVFILSSNLKLLPQFKRLLMAFGGWGGRPSPRRCPGARPRTRRPRTRRPPSAEVTGLSTWTLVSTNESATPAQGPGLRAPPCPEPGWGGCGRSRREPHPLPPRVPLASVSASQSEYLIGFTIFFFIGNF